MNENDTSKIAKLYRRTKLLFTYIGDKHKLVFFSSDNDNYLELNAKLVDNTYFISINKEYFNKTLKENKDALKELEKVLSYNTGIASYFYYGLGYLFFLWTFMSYPSALSGYLLYKLPFYLQIIGIGLIYSLVFLLPLWLLFKIRENKIKTVSKADVMLHYLKNEEYRQKMNEFKKAKETKLKWWNKQIVTTKISPFHNVGKKVIIIYSVLFLFIIALFSFFKMRVDLPASYLPILYNEKAILDYSNTDIIKTKYEFTEKTSPLTINGSYQPCGRYICDRYNASIYDNNFNLVDLNQYLNVDESFNQILTINEGIVVFNYCKADVKERGYKIVDLNTNTIINDLNPTTLNIEDTFYIFVDALVANGEIYLGGTLGEGGNQVGYLVKVDQNNNIITNLENEGIIVSTVTMFNNKLYLTEVSKVDSFNTIIKTIDQNLKVIDKVEITEFRTIYVTVVNDEILLRAYEKGMTNFYQIAESLKLKKVYTSVLDGFHIYTDSNTLYSGMSLKSYFEYDQDFNKINKGLACYECSDSDYFKQYYFIKSNNKLYAINDDFTLVFTETANYHYSLSRSPLTTEGFVLYLAAYLIPLTVTLNVLSRRKKEALVTNEYLKQLLNDNET